MYFPKAAACAHHIKIWSETSPEKPRRAQFQTSTVIHSPRAHLLTVENRFHFSDCLNSTFQKIKCLTSQSKKILPRRNPLQYCCAFPLPCGCIPCLASGFKATKPGMAQKYCSRARSWAGSAAYPGLLAWQSMPIIFICSPGVVWLGAQKHPQSAQASCCYSPALLFSYKKPPKVNRGTQQMFTHGAGARSGGDCLLLP